MQSLASFCFSLLMTYTALVGPEGINLENKHIHVTAASSEGALVEEFRLVATNHDLAGKEGMFQEGFGIGSFYVPNRRLNERIEVLEDVTDHAAFRYSYDCDGPNIKNLHVTRTVEFFDDRSGIRVTWQVENRGDEDQWIAPWVRCDVAPGGTFDSRDRFDVPTPDGIVQPRRNTYVPASRNWVAATDPVAKETVYGVFNAEELHSFLILYDLEDSTAAFQAAFVPRVLAKGQKWQTIYYVNAVRGLEYVDFASEEFAVQVEYAPGLLRTYFAPAQPLASAVIRTRIRSGDDVQKLPDKQFDFNPPTIVRCTYDWRAPVDGMYELLAQMEQQGKPLALGKDTASPHGGIDTYFIAGTPSSVVFEPWTDAPYQLDHGGRKLKRQPAVVLENLHAWAESSLTKVFREDILVPIGTPNPTASISLAKNEHESFQIVLRAAGSTPITQVSVRVHDLVNASGSSTIPAQDITARRVGYYPVRIPTHFETPTGDWPDPLLPDDPFTVPAGECVPLWFTVYARPDLTPGIYKGLIEITAAEVPPVELFLEARVRGFSLPDTPRLKTDIGFLPEIALAQSKSLGYQGSLVELITAYKQDAFAHRVTLREIAQLPPENPDYTAALRNFERAFSDLTRRGATTFAVPPSLIDVPDQLKQADDFVASHNLSKRAFCPLTDQPARPAWPRLLERMQLWKTTAPNIPVMVTTYGLEPFLPDALDIWAVHLPVMDTTNNRRILERVQAGGEVWLYVNHEPARPYPNLFIDFESIEHRILFWQAWALGAKGFHYASINAAEPSQNPYTDQLDITPSNGNGFLVYPGKNGPIASIRWENIRDGIDDYDYLTIFHELLAKLEKTSPTDPLIKRARAAANLNEIMPSLVGFSRDPNVLLNKREELAALIEEMTKKILAK
ncbi:MAG TPA: DUF4091 domain-containing protein [Candidatus Hydrogenedentes bacterium]|nr:DUF4091 domain-containing protein [Candidatus Hydrogenedentota bacterium]HOL77320.1 DUF4091 domain-containing protein [Candidatus Hydrogenedentota bacterium]